MYAYSYARRKWLVDSNVPPAIYALLSYLMALFVSYNLFPQVGCKTTLVFSSIPALAAFYLIDSARRMFRLELIQRTIGFYSYASIFSRVLEALYSRATSSRNYFYTNTGNFSDLEKAIESRYNIEKERVERRKYYLATAFTLITVTLAMFKFAVEVENGTPSAQNELNGAGRNGHLRRSDKLDFLCDYLGFLKISNAEEREEQVPSPPATTVQPPDLKKR